MNICKNCGQEAGIGVRGRMKIYCNKRCASIHRMKIQSETKPKTGKIVKCKFCKNNFYVMKCFEKYGRGKFCSKSCKAKYYFENGQSIPNLYHPGRPFIDQGKKRYNPYKRVVVNGKQVKVHRRVMELHLNRELTRSECVHHINGDKHDNRIENLMIVTRSQHAKIEYDEGKYLR